MELALKDLSKLTPLAAVLVVVGIVLAWMLTRQMALGTWLLAAFLLGHGLVHVMFAVPAPSGRPHLAEWNTHSTQPSRGSLPATCSPSGL